MVLDRAKKRPELWNDAIQQDLGPNLRTFPEIDDIPDVPRRSPTVKPPISPEVVAYERMRRILQLAVADLLRPWAIHENNPRKHITNAARLVQSGCMLCPRRT